MTANLTAFDLRRWAMRCATEAASADNDADRARLLKMQQALIQLAENEDWLNGKSSTHPDFDNDAEIIALAERITGLNKAAS